MSTRRSRALYAAVASIVPIALVVATVSHQTPRRSPVATDGPTTRSTSDPETVALSLGPREAGSDPETPTTTQPVPPAALTTGRGLAPPDIREQTRPTVAVPDDGAGPATTTTSPTPPVPKGPHDLLGRVVYLTGDQQAWSMLPDGSDRRREVQCPMQVLLGSGYVAVSPDGTQLLRPCGVESPGNPYMFGRNQVFAQQVDGSGQRVVYESPSGHPVEASWAPDGGSIVIAEIAQHADLLIVDLVTMEQRRVSTPAGTSLGRPEWSPDGNLLALPGPTVLDPATGELRPLTDSPETHPDTELAWSPDGEWIYYADKFIGYDLDTGRYRNTVNRVRVATGEIEVLVPWTDLDGSLWGTAQRPVFAPDGSVLFVDNTKLWAMDPDGAHRRVLDDDFSGWSLSAAPPSAG